MSYIDRELENLLKDFDGSSFKEPLDIANFLEDELPLIEDLVTQEGNATYTDLCPLQVGQEEGGGGVQKAIVQAPEATANGPLEPTLVVPDGQLSFGLVNGQLVFMTGSQEMVSVQQVANGQELVLSPQDQTLQYGQVSSVQSPSGAEDSRPVGSPMMAVAPSEVFGDSSSAPKKRGRKRKTDPSSGCSPRRQRPKKPKVYEILTPFEDEEEERKRKNAHNAKKHRDLQKQKAEEMRAERDALRMERDALQQKVAEMGRKFALLVQQLQVYQKKEVDRFVV